MVRTIENRMDFFGGVELLEAVSHPLVLVMYIMYNILIAHCVVCQVCSRLSR